MEILEISINQIREIEPSAFNGIPNLNILYLNANELNFLPENVFKTNLNLETILLHANKLNALSTQTFSNLPNLETLVVYGNICIDLEWYGEAFQKISEIEKALIPCHVEFIRMEPNKKIAKNSKIIGNLENQMESLTAKLDAVGSNQKNLGTKLSKVEENISNFNATLSNKMLEISNSIEITDANDAKFETRLKAVESKIESFGRKLDEINENLEKNNKNTDTLQSLMQLMQEQNQYLIKLESKTEEKIKKINENMEAASRNLKIVEKDIDHSNTKYELADAKILYLSESMKATQIEKFQKFEEDLRLMNETINSFANEKKIRKYFSSR